MNTYLVITQEFAESYRLYGVGSNYFGYSITKDGRYVCTLQSSIEFPLIFEGTDFEQVQLTKDDFPDPPDDVVV